MSAKTVCASFSKTRRALVLASLVTALLSTRSAEAAFQDGFGGARFLALGGASVAVVNDTDSLAINPAGLANLAPTDGDRTQLLSATYGGLFVGLDDGSRIGQSYLGYALSVGGKDSLGVAWKRTSVSEAYVEDRIAVAAARRMRFAEGNEQGEGRLVLGLQAELLKWDTAPVLGETGNILEDLEGPTRLDVTVGAIYTLTSSGTVRVPLGVAFHHVTQPNVASSRSKEPERLPLQIVFGIGAESERTLWTLDILMEQRDVDIRTGIEWAAQPKTLFLRAGIRLEGLALGTNLTLGAGFHLNRSTRLDYAFWLPVGNVADTWGGHRFSVNYWF